ncbi:MAG: aspartate-semialdehyde dehydrogenase [Clostridiales bacterium]|jgi:aspartate-semialdehyde dehydrogenase|nr:aspartate-semialdehyde dehydrogenase [Clostridiales bacterium]
MKKYNIAVVGATGMVGNKFLKVLSERNLPVENYYLYASAKSAGKKIDFMGKEPTVIELARQNIIDKKIDIALFSAGASVSREFAPVFVEAGAVVIDNSSCFRMDDDVPLVVPEVNPEDIFLNKGIIANPNCSTIQAVVALKPLNDKYKIKRIVYSTYQSVSGAGMGGYTDLIEGVKGNPPKKFPYPIFNNLIPQIDVFLDDGYTKEEVKMINETRKILHEKDLKITATTVRVPVPFGHSESINVEFERPCTLDGIKSAIKNQEGIIFYDDIANGIYPMPCVCEDKDEVFVGRIRLDESVDSGCNIFVVADNIRKGAATNAVQIAEYIIKNDVK